MGTPLNNSGLTALAMQLAADYYNRQITASLDEVFPGTYAWQPDGVHDLIWSMSERSKQGSLRVLKTQWNQTVKDFQHSIVPLSGFTNIPKGVGGHSVAQSWRDSVEAPSQAPIPITLQFALASGDNAACLASVDYLPTQNRWVGVIDNERILFEGTSGGDRTEPQCPSGFVVDIVYRGIDGTIETSHSGPTFSPGNPNTPVSGPASGFMSTPNTTYGVNLVTYEKGQFVYPNEWTSGGIQGLRVVPQIQTVQPETGDSLTLKGIKYYSGKLLTFDATLNDNPWRRKESIWLIERNNAPLSPALRYDGQLVGYSPTNSGKTEVAPVYAIDSSSLSGHGPTQSGQLHSGDCFAVFTGDWWDIWSNAFPSGNPLNASGFISGTAIDPFNTYPNPCACFVNGGDSVPYPCLPFSGDNSTPQFSGLTGNNCCWATPPNDSGGLNLNPGGTAIYVKSGCPNGTPFPCSGSTNPSTNLCFSGSPFLPGFFSGINPSCFSGITTPPPTPIPPGITSGCCFPSGTVPASGGGFLVGPSPGIVFVPGPNGMFFPVPIFPFPSPVLPPPPPPPAQGPCNNLTGVEDCWNLPVIGSDGQGNCSIEVDWKGIQVQGATGADVTNCNTVNAPCATPRDGNFRHVAKLVYAPCDFKIQKVTVDNPPDCQGLADPNVPPLDSLGISTQGVTTNNIKVLDSTCNCLQLCFRNGLLKEFKAC